MKLFRQWFPALPKFVYLEDNEQWQEPQLTIDSYRDCNGKKMVSIFLMDDTHAACLSMPYKRFRQLIRGIAEEIL